MTETEAEQRRRRWVQLEEELGELVPGGAQGGAVARWRREHPPEGTPEEPAEPTPRE